MYVVNLILMHLGREPRMVKQWHVESTTEVAQWLLDNPSYGSPKPEETLKLPGLDGELELVLYRINAKPTNHVLCVEGPIENA